jgi:hypothetical protein
MISRTNRRLVAVVCAVVGSALLQACAMTTGPYVPSRPTATNRSMTSRYDVLRQQSVSSGHRHMTVTRERGLFDYRYY